MSELDSYLNEESIPSIEELLMENVEQAELIQKLLSEKSGLQQVVQEKQLVLQEMQEKIVNLNNSDLQLNEAEWKLKESKEKLAEAEKLERDTIEADNRNKQLYEKSVRQLSLKEETAMKYEKTAKHIIDNQNKILDEKAEHMTASARISLEMKYQEKEKNLKSAYKSKEIQLHAITFGGLLYGVYVTMLTVATTIRFKSDVKALMEGSCGIVVWIWGKLLMIANTVSEVCNNISNQFIAEILGFLLHWLIILLLLAMIIGAISWGMYHIFQFYKTNFADMRSLVVTLISLSLLVWFGDYIGSITKLNLIFIFLLIHGGYMGLRMYAEKK